MSVVSAGILLYRRAIGSGKDPKGGADNGDGSLEVWIAHMGGPFWARKDAHAWSIPKGLVEPGEESLDTARREFAEELGIPAPPAEYVLLGEFRQKSGKLVRAYVAEAPPGFDIDVVQSNTFTTEWPRGSGTLREFPEIDRASWVSVRDARLKLVAGQVALLDALSDLLAE